MFVLSFAVVGVTSGMASAQTKANEGVPDLSTTATIAAACDVVFGGDPFADVPSEGLVSRGEPVSINVTWGTGWESGSTVEVLGCAAVDGRFSEELSSRTRELEQDGLLMHEFSVPKDVADGATVCERAVVIGRSTTGAAKSERLDADCFTVAGGAEEPSAGSAAPEATEPAPRTGGATASREHHTDADTPARTPAQAGPEAVGGTEPMATPGVPVPAPAGLARTGNGDGMLALAAGLLFILGGGAIAVSRPFGTAPH